MTVFEQDVATLEAAMRGLMRTMKRPQTWTRLTELADITLDRPGAAILRILLHPTSGTSCRLNDIADILGVEAPTITRKTQQLEAAGLVFRERDAKDGRAYSLHISEKGRTIARKLDTAQRQILEAALSEWPETDRQQFIRLFARFSNDLSMQYEPPKPT